MKRFIKKILVPVDGSEYSKKALDMAIVIAKDTGGQLTILEVIEGTCPFPSYYVDIPENVDRVKWISEQRFEEIHPMLEEEGVNWERLIVEGYPPEKICEIAEEKFFDLIVIGSRGHSALNRFLLGSVSDRIVHHAPCSVMVVK